MSRPLSTFPGGLHLPDHKAISTTRPVQPLPLPQRLVLPLQQHIGEPAQPLVAVGERVLKGQTIALAEGFVSAPLHAPSSGTVVAIEERAVPHPSGLSAPCIVIETDGREEWRERKPVGDFRALEPSALRNIVREAGIVGLGGAGFPAFIKLNPGARTYVDTLILNGAECEPYISCDDMLMRERASEVVSGARIMRHALQARECLIGIEDNKPEALAAIRTALAQGNSEGIEVVAVPTRYPTGGEKQLIKVLTGKEVRSGGLPLDIGVVCHNVATAASIHHAVILDEPLISRIVTVTGEAVANPCNLEVPLGAPMQALLEAAGGTNTGVGGDAGAAVMGGPMMGITLASLELPVIKTSNCLLIGKQETATAPERPCIRCGSCVDVCPMRLLPQQLYWYARAKDFDKAQDYNLFDCIECGCCAYVCPSQLPLVHYYRFAKTNIWAQEREKQAADKARQRHEFRQAREAAEKAERAALLARKKAALAASKKQEKGDKADEADKNSDDAKKAAIKAAMERAKAKKAAAGVNARNTEDLTPAQQAQIDEAEARRAAAQEQAQEQKQAQSVPAKGGDNSKAAAQDE